MVKIFLQCVLCQHEIIGDEQVLLVKGSCICPDCEARIVRLHIDDLEYDYYKNGLKKVWWYTGA